MPYQIKTKDGITIRNIPDDVASDSQVLKDRVAAIRAGNMAPVSGAAAIPGATPEQLAASARAPAAPPADPSLVDRLIGAGETALTLATGATGGTLGTIGGTIGGLAGAIAQGEYGTQQGVERIAQAAQEGAAGLTYAPRTAAGQEMVAAVGEVAQDLAPVGAAVAPLTAEMAALSQGMRQAAAAARAPAASAVRTAQQAVAPAIERMRTSAPAVAERVQRTLRRLPDDQPRRGSAGAAATPEELQRRTTAEDLPVPISLTKGQATREQPQLMFEKETAKLAEGGLLRDRYAQQNQQILQNFDAWVDQTGAEAPSLRAIGKIVDGALVKKSRRDKAEIRSAYVAAEKAGEMEDPVTLQGLIDHLNENRAFTGTAPLLNDAIREAVRTGVAQMGDDGVLSALPVTIKTAEKYRTAVGRATNYDGPNIYQSTIIKGLIDAETDGVGGSLYRSARRLRENYAKQYEERAIINNLLTKKRGSADRKVAFEDVLENIMIRGDMDDVRHMRRVLQTGAPEGQQAWRELQGGTLNWMREQATKGVSSDQSGAPIVSADGLNRAVKTLDADGKLDFIFGKRGAQQIRDINEITKLVHTVPSGSINTSGTSAALLMALTEAGATGAMTGLPVPILSVGRALAKHRKDIKLQKRIDEALARRPNPKRNS